MPVTSYGLRAIARRVFLRIQTEWSVGFMTAIHPTRHGYDRGVDTYKSSPMMAADFTVGMYREHFSSTA